MKRVTKAISTILIMLVSISIYSTILDTKVEAATPTVLYNSHVAFQGWEKDFSKSNGELSGTQGKALRLEGIKIKLSNMPSGVSVKYQTHIQNIGWQNWKKDGELSGTEGQSLRLEGIKIKLEGTKEYKIQYRVHIQNLGWQEWKSDGEFAGTEGESLRLEAIEIKLVSVTNPTVEYSSHVAFQGWERDFTKSNGALSGTTGKNLGMQAIKMRLKGVPNNANITYQTHVQNIGWQNWTSEENIAGTTGKSLNIEAIKIKLNNLPGKSIMYRVHVQNIGWQDWKKDGELAGTEGQKLRIEAIEIKIVSNVIIDTTKPVITLKGANPQIINVGTPYIELGATVTDNIDTGLNVSINSSDVNTSKLGTYVVKYNATDKSGNKANEVTRTVKVVDTTKPVITLKGVNPQIINVGTQYTELGATVTDNYDTGLNVSINSTNVNINRAGAYVVKYNATDKSGNKADEVTRTVKVIDTVKPNIILSPTNIYEMEVKTSKPVLKATATDNSDENITVKITDNINVNVVGKYTVTFTATDSSNNTETITKEFIVKDTTAPVITLNTLNTYISEVKSVKPIFRAIVTDNYDTNVELEITDNIDMNKVGTYIVTFTAIDDSANKTTIEKEFKVVDTTKPIITVDSTNTYEMEVNGTKPEFKATATDNYDIDVKLEITDNIDVNMVGKYTVTFTATDSSNNKEIITKEFNVKSKELIDINININKTTGYSKENIEIGTVLSGLNQRDLTLEELKFYITDENGNEITDINKIQIEKKYGVGNVIEDGIIVTVNAKEAGIYNITPYVGTSINDPKVIKVNKPAQIDVTNNPIVTSISVDEILEQELMINKSVDKNITFKNKYNEQIAVTANRISVNLTDGININLLDKYGDIIDGSRPAEDVAAIRFITTLAEKITKNITITVDGITKTVNVNVSEGARVESIITNNDMILYGQIPSESQSDVIQTENGEIYTIIPIEIQNQHQEKMNLFGNMSIEKITGEKLQVIDNIYNPNNNLDTPRITTKMYKKVGGKYEIAADTDKADYIGISLTDEESIGEMNGKKVLLKVGGKVLKEINVTVPIMRLTSIEIEKGITQGKINENIQIGVVKSGKNQVSVTKEQLKYHITDKDDKVITDSSIISVIGQYGPGNVVEDGVVLTLNSTKSGIYKITPYVGTSINDPDIIKISNPIEVSIDIDLVVNSIEINNSINISKGKAIDQDIIFKNKDSEQINVSANRIEIDKTLAEGVVATLLDKTGNVIGLDRPNEDVGGIRFTTTLESETTKTLSVKVDGITKTIQINVEGKPKLTSIQIDSNINLYETEPTNTTETIKVENIGGTDVIYTLKEIKLKDQRGTLIKLFANYSIETDSTNKLIIKDSLTPVGDPLPYIDVKLYKDYNGEIVEALALDEVKYIGISLAEGTKLSDLAGEKVQIMYNGNILAEINII